MKALIQLAEVVGAAISAVLMVGVFVGGIKKIGGGVWGLLAFEDSAAGIGNVLKGLELIFLAPLVLLAYVSMILFVHGFLWVVAQKRAETVGGHIAGASIPHSSLVFVVKESMAALLIAVLLTDIVSHALSDSTSSWLAFSVDAVGVVLSGAYLFLLSKVARH